jgi:hypothetical protein
VCVCARARARLCVIGRDGVRHSCSLGKIEHYTLLPIKVAYIMETQFSHTLSTYLKTGLFFGIKDVYVSTV